MLKAIREFIKMPGGFKTVNVFDAIYSALTMGLVETLGTGARVLSTAGLGLNEQWEPGEKIKILFLAYSGARNTGAEVRVAECIDQVNKVLGEDKVEINMTTLNMEEAEEYFKDNVVNLVPMSPVFFKDVFKFVRQNHLVVLVEGSCWKENFAAALLLYFLYGVGLASKMGKPSFSYAVDAGKMNKLNNFISWYLSKGMTRLITRSADSNKVLEKISLPGAFNRVDTAWTQKAKSATWAKDKLKELGWDGKKKLAGTAFQNYFWWPIVPDFVRWVKSIVTKKAEYQYRLLYFYDYGEQDKAKYKVFTQNVADYMDWMTETYDIQPVLIAMEALDEGACRDAMAIMKHKPILISCNEFVGTEIAAMLRQLSLLTTTRYHAMVLSMPGKVPFIGLSRDERIRGVMKELDLYKDYYVDYQTKGLLGVLKEKAQAILGSKDESERLKKAINDNLPYYYAQMGMLGLDIRELVRESFPGFEPVELDEENLKALIPHVPNNLAKASQTKFAELKAQGR